MTKDEIPTIANESLTDLLGEPGSILYSSHETLKPGSIYLLGFNPGGNNGAPLSESVRLMLSYSDNAYTDESWSNGNDEWEPGNAPLQQRIQWLINDLAWRLPPSALAT